MELEILKQIAKKYSIEQSTCYCVVKLKSCSCLEIYKHDKAIKEKNIEILKCYDKGKDR